MTAAGILLCAGYGTRLKPLTDALPKPAVPFMGHPMVWYAMRALKAAGIDKIAANLHHLPQKMADCLNACSAELGMEKPTLFVEDADKVILGTGGGARGCFEQFSAWDRAVIYHGDVLCGADIAKAVSAHEKSGAEVTLLVAPRAPESKLGMVGIDRHQRIARIRDWFLHGTDPAQIMPCCFTGVHIVERAVIERLPLGKPICLVTEVYPKMLADGAEIHAHWIDGFFADIGTPLSYIEAQRALLECPEKLPGAAVSRCAPMDNVEVELPVFIHPDLHLPPCHIGPNVYLDRNAHVEPGECIRDEMRMGSIRLGIGQPPCCAENAKK